MNPKTRPNDRRYIAVLRSMSPEARLRKAFELSEMTRQLFRLGLERRFPGRSADDLNRIYLERLAECRNQDF